MVLAAVWLISPDKVPDSFISRVPPFNVNPPASVPASERVNVFAEAIVFPVDTVNVLPEAIAMVELLPVVSVLIVAEAFTSKLAASVPLIETLSTVPAPSNFKILESLLRIILLLLVNVPAPAKVSV